MEQYRQTKSVALILLAFVSMKPLSQLALKLKPVRVKITSDIVLKMDSCFTNKEIDVCKNKPEKFDIDPCLKDVVGESEYIDTTEMNNVLAALYKPPGGVPIYHQVLIEKIINQLIDNPDFTIVISSDKENVLKHIFGLQAYAKENPFVALCYIKLVESLINQILKAVIECYYLMKSLNDNAPKLGAAEISTLRDLISESKRPIESSVATYKVNINKILVGKLDTLIERILKDKAGDDEVFKILQTYTKNLLSETLDSQGDPISDFVGRFKVIEVAPASVAKSEPPDDAVQRPNNVNKKNGDAIVYGSAAGIIAIILVGILVYLVRMRILLKRRHRQTSKLIRSYAGKLVAETELQQN